MAGAALGLSAASLGIAEQQGNSSAVPADEKNLLPEYFGSVSEQFTHPLLKVGFAERDITPKIGLQMAGDYVPTFVRGFHDPCKVRVAVFDDGSRSVALVGIDVLVVPESVVKAAREKIHSHCGMDPASILLGAAHNHSGGPVGIV